MLFSSSHFPIIATSFSQDNSSEFSPMMPDEVREHLTRDQRPFLQQSLQIHQIHSSMTVLLFCSPHSFSTGFGSENWHSHIAEASFWAQRHIFVLILMFESMMPCIWTRYSGPLAEKQAHDIVDTAVYLTVDMGYFLSPFSARKLFLCFVWP